jgi:hypothetical protein
MKLSTGQYTPEKQTQSIENVYGGLLENRKKEVEALIENLESQVTSTTNA